MSKFNYLISIIILISGCVNSNTLTIPDYCKQIEQEITKTTDFICAKTTNAILLKVYEIPTDEKSKALDEIQKVTKEYLEKVDREQEGKVIVCDNNMVYYKTKVSDQIMDEAVVMTPEYTLAAGRIYNGSLDALSIEDLLNDLSVPCIRN